MKNFKFYALAGLAVAATFTGLALKPFTIVDEGTEGVVYNWDGTIDEAALLPGFHWVSPFDSVKEVDTTYRKFTLDNIGVPAQDNLKTTMDITFTGHFIKGMTPHVLIDNGSTDNFIQNHILKRLEANVIEAGKAQAKTSQDFYGKETVPLMTKEIVKTTNDELIPLGFRVTSVEFSDQRLPDVVTRAVVQTKTRIENINQQKAAYQIADLKAKENTAVANANANSLKLMADAKAYSLRKAAEARAFQISTEAKAQAQANKELSHSLTPSIIQNKLADAALKWDGRSMPRMITSEQMAMMPQFQGMLK